MRKKLIIVLPTLMIVIICGGYYLYRALASNKTEIVLSEGSLPAPKVMLKNDMPGEPEPTPQREQVKLAMPRIMKSDFSSTVSEISQRNTYIDREKHIWDLKNAGQPANIPQVEFRFVKRNILGHFEPAMVATVSLLPTIDGKPQNVKEYEHTGIEFKDTGRTNLEDFFGGYIVRLPWSEGSKREHRGGQRGRYVFGGMTYHVSVIPSDKPDLDYYDRPSAIVKMPDQIPVGHKYVVEFDVGKKVLSPYAAKYHELVVRAPIELSGQDVYFTSAMNGIKIHEMLDVNGTCKFRVQQTKGSLKVVEKLPSGQFLTRHTVDNISGELVVLPKNASWSLRLSDLVRFKLKLVGISEPNSLNKPSILFSRDKDGLQEVAWMEYISSTEVDVSIPVGTYYLFLGKDLVSAKRNRVTVSQALSGSPLTVKFD